MRVTAHHGVLGIIGLFLVAGCGGSTTGRGLPASKTAPGSIAAASTPAGGTASTSSQGTAAPTTPANDPRKDELRAIVDAYVASGDLGVAVDGLTKKNATPAEMLALLRGPRKLAGPLVGGPHAVTIKDSTGTPTDLQIVAPAVAEIQARASKGLGLVVMLHGINGNGGQVVGRATELAATNDIVAVAPTAQRLPAGFAAEDGIPASVATQFPTWWMYENNRSYAMEAIRTACSLYPIDPERVVLCGASMGGYGTWNIGLRHVDRFAALAPLCGGLSRLGQAGMSDPRSDALLVNGLMAPLWAAHGDADTVVPIGPDQQAASSLKQLGGDVTFHVLPGVGHDIKTAVMGSGSLASELRTFVTTKRRKAQPLSVNYLSAGETLDGAHWLRIVSRVGGRDRVTITGSIDKATNAITVSTDGVVSSRVYLDDRILDLTKPVTVKTASGVRFQGMATPSLGSILESWRSREDEGLVFPAHVEVDPR